MRRPIHQILPVLRYGDAIGNLALELRGLLRQWGYQSEIFAGSCDPRLAKVCRPFRQYARFSHADNCLIVHYSTGSEINRLALTLPDRVVIHYHNLTPAHFIDWTNGELAQHLREAQRDLRTLAGRVPAICDSPYNQQELEKIGFEVIGVVPPLLSFAHLDGARERKPSPPKNGSITWLHVGRLAPNKCLHDVIKAFYYYHRWITPRSRLFIVGGAVGMQSYAEDLRHLAAQLALEQAVVFAGHVDDLAPFYRIADLYISMSEHEGFCIPLVEAMYCDIPILAYASTAVPSTLGNAGVLVHHKDHAMIAEIAHEMVVNENLRKQLLRGQRVRLAAFTPEVVCAQFRTCLDRMLES